MRCWNCGNDNPDGYERCWNCRERARAAAEGIAPAGAAGECLPKSLELAPQELGAVVSETIKGGGARPPDRRGGIAIGGGVATHVDVKQKIVIKGDDGAAQTFNSIEEMPPELRARLERELREAGIDLAADATQAGQSLSVSNVPEYVRQFLDRSAGVGPERGMTFRIHGSGGGLIGVGIGLAAGLIGGLAAWKVVSGR